jgi:hypothetical protein
MATGCDRRSLDPFEVPLDVRMRNRKLRNTRSDPFGSVHGVLSTTSAFYYRVLALVICPFYFHIVSTLLRVHLKISTCKMFFLYFYT